MKYNALLDKSTRRRFIQQMGYAAFAIPPIAMSAGGRNEKTGSDIAQPDAHKGSGSEQRKLGIALVGLGKYSSEQLAPALKETKRCRLAGIVTGTPHKAEEWKRKYDIPDKNVYSY